MSVTHIAGPVVVIVVGSVVLGGMAMSEGGIFSYFFGAKMIEAGFQIAIALLQVAAGSR